MSPLRYAAALLVLAPPALAQCQNDRLAPALPAASDQFGHRVAIDGDWALVGAPAAGTALAGSATFFERDGEGWIERQTVAPPVPTFNDQFGAAVALSGDFAVVGAPRVDDAGPQDHGAAYVFRLDQGTWVEDQILLPDPPVADQRFGYSVAVDGTTLLVGAPQHTLATSPPFETFQGVVYSFDHDGTDWVKGLVFRALVPEDKGVFGSSVALSGNTAVIGSSNPSWLGMESAFVYVRAGDWDLVSEIQPPGFVPGERFSSSVDVDGLRIAVGAPKAAGGGKAYLFLTAGGGTVSLEDTLQPPGLSAGAELGRALALGPDRLAVGAPLATPAAGEEGEVHLFELDGGTWSETATLAPGDAGSVGLFGTALDLDGDRLLVGAADGTSPAGSGAAYEFQLAPEDCLFVTDTKTISLSAGGTQEMALSAGPDLAGQTYLVLGSTSGTAPGVPLGFSILLPLNVDPYFVTSILSANTPPFVGTFGVLDGDGAAAAAFTLPAGFNPGLAGLELHHAFVALDAGTNAPVFASNPRVLRLLE